MPMREVPEIGAEKPVPVSGASDMQFGTKFFWYQFSVIQYNTIQYKFV